MSDLERARALLQGNLSYTCAFVSGDNEKTSEQRGVRPLLELINAGETLAGWAAADRVVGRAAALLYVCLGVQKLYAEVLSKPAEAVLKVHRIEYGYAILTDGIKNRSGDGPCPMEQATMEIFDPQEGLQAIRAKLKELAN